MSADSRGQTAVLGIVLLIGIVAIGSIGLLVAAGETVSQAEQDAEQERIEQAFVELSQKMATTSTNDDTSQEMDFEAGEHGAITKTNAGTITIEYGDEELDPIEIGAIEYQADDGSIVAYQAGGVWRERGNETRMLSSPQVHYEDMTLTLPIATVSGEQNLDSGSISLSHAKTESHGSLAVENETVTMTIKSEYYRGWESYFKSQAGQTVVRDIDHENRTVTVLLGYDEIENAFNSDTSYASDDGFHDQHDHFENPSHNPLPPLDSTIHQMVRDAKNHEEIEGMDVKANLSESDPEQPLTDGTYFIEEIEEGDSFDFDISEGNATLIVEGDIHVGGSASIKVVERNENHALKIYSAGERLNLDGEVCVDECEKTGAKYIQLYGASDMAVDLGPNKDGTFEGLLYVASDEEKDWWEGEKGGGNCGSDYQVRMQAGDVDVFGSVVAYSVCAHSSGMEFEYDDDLTDADIEVYPEEYPLPPQITYLNIAEYEIDVENQ